MIIKELIKTYPSASWIGGISLLIGLLTAAAQIGQRNNLIDQKVDKAVYEHDIGQIKGDLRVIKSAVCGSNPAACQQ